MGIDSNIELMNSSQNNIYIKRDDKYGSMFGGNKARKLDLFIEDAIKKNSDYLVTYGSTHSNHCRLTAAYAAQNNMKCLLILARPDEEPEYNGNYFLYDLLDAETVYTDIDKVSENINEELERLKAEGYNPYFIQGGGHGNLGTKAYVMASKEIEKQEVELGIKFDYIFFASGTGTTQAGLIIGNELYDIAENIIGISIAREKARGKRIIRESIEDYCNKYEIEIDEISDKINFIDEYIGSGYGELEDDILLLIKEIAKKEGIVLDPVYTGKAFYGMKQYIEEKKIEDKTILFIHTGGTPILFSHAEKFKRLQE